MYSVDLEDLRESLEPDMVLSPPHYQGKVECIESIRAQLGEDGFRDYCHGNVAKYLWRWREKGGVEDLRKAKWYLERMIEVAGG